MTVNELTKKQEEMIVRIKQNAENKGLSKKNPILNPIYDGVADIAGYVLLKPKIMWILKEPYDDFTPAGKPKGGDWSLMDIDFRYGISNMHKVMMQISYAIHNNLDWKKLDYIDDNPDMITSLKQCAYINISKMPAETTSSDTHLWDCYPKWKDIILEQIKLYNPDIIIFGNTFMYLRNDLNITENDKPIYTVSGKWCSGTYQKDGVIFIDAYHPARKGGEDGSHDYVTSIVNAVKKVLNK